MYLFLQMQQRSILGQQALIENDVQYVSGRQQNVGGYVEASGLGGGGVGGVSAAGAGAGAVPGAGAGAGGVGVAHGVGVVGGGTGVVGGSAPTSTGASVSGPGGNIMIAPNQRRSPQGHIPHGYSAQGAYGRGSGSGQ